jgi:hypothetical protein
VIKLFLSVVLVTFPFVKSLAQCQCSALESRIARLERAVFQGTGTVRTKDLSKPQSSGSISPEKKRKLMKNLKEIKDRKSEHQKYLDEMMEEDL